MKDVEIAYLVDPDSRLYRVTLEKAIAAIESLGLSHRDVYLDPGLDETCLQAIAAERAALSQARERRERFFQLLGYVGIGMLLFNLFVLSFP